MHTIGVKLCWNMDLCIEQNVEERSVKQMGCRDSENRGTECKSREVVLKLYKTLVRP